MTVDVLPDMDPQGDAGWVTRALSELPTPASPVVHDALATAIARGRAWRDRLSPVRG